MITDKYVCKIIGSHGPSMSPTLDSKDNILLVDCFSYKFIRNPKKGDIIICDNPFKPGATLVKRIINTQNEMA